jgi:polysaccharide export outer membrane protein
MMKRMTMLFALLASAASSFAAEPPPAPAAAAIAVPAPGPGQIGEGSNYIVGPGDTVQIFVWRNPDLSGTFPVRPDGKLTAPMVEDLVAVGQTPSGLARVIEQKLAEYIRDPQVNVIITNPQSAFSKVTAIGQVRTPQAVPYRQGMTVLDVVLAVGGLGDFAAGNKAKIVRKDATGKERDIPVRLNDLVKKGRTRNNVEMQPGDLLIVPESKF